MTVGYVPDDDGGKVKSGVTIGTGIDLGTRSVKTLKDLELGEKLILKLEPYCGLTGESARGFLAKNPLTLSRSEVDQLDYGVIERSLELLEARFDEDSEVVSFSKLPGEIQTVIFSLAHQYGNLKLRTPKFWHFITTLHWDSAYAELLDFGDAFQTRRLKEAALLKRGMDKFYGEL